MLCVSFKSLLFLPYLPHIIFLPPFHCISRTIYSGNNDPCWYGWNSVTSVSIETNKYIPAHHLLCGQWYITVYVISYPVYTCGINTENMHPHTWRRTSVGLRNLTVSMRYAQRCSTPRGMRLQRPCQCGCLSPSDSETWFNTNCNKFWGCFIWSPCYFYFFSLSRITQNFQPLTKKKKEKKKACSSAVFKNFCCPSNHCCPVKWIRQKVYTAAKETEGQSNLWKNVDYLLLFMKFCGLNNC